MKIPKLKVNDRVEILWHDAHDCGEEGQTWTSREFVVQAKENYEVLSLGYFVKLEQGFIYIAGDLINTLVGRPTAVPIACIKAVRKL